MTTTEIPSRLLAGDPLLAEIRRNPPKAHPSAPAGVWSATLDCLEFIHSQAAGKVTLETGCGASTIVFVAVAACHAAVFLGPAEGEAVAQWCTEHGLAVRTATPVGGLRRRQ